MKTALLGIGALVTLVGATYEVALLTVRRTELADAVTRRLRGDAVAIAWPATVARDLAAASATTSIGLVLIGAALPAFFSGAARWEALLAVVALVLPVTLLGGYLLPRWLVMARAERAVRVLHPLVRPWSVLLGLVLPAPEPGESFRALGREGAAVLPGADPEMSMVGGVITFAQRPVREVMTPRTEIVAVAEGTAPEAIVAAFRESGYSRIPVFRESLDEVVGMLHAFDLFTLDRGEPLPVRPVTLTPASRLCGDLLLDMQRERRHLAVVLDEFGGTLGIVTLEDLLSALVGEIYDEGSMEPVGGATPAEVAFIEADAGMAVEAVEERLGVTLPPGHAATVGGRVAELAGRIPAAGERLLVGGLEVDVLQASPNRLERLVLWPRPPVPVPLPREGA